MSRDSGRPGHPATAARPRDGRWEYPATGDLVQTAFPGCVLIEGEAKEADRND